MRTTKEVVTQAEAAKRLGISRQSLGVWVKRPGAPIDYRRNVAYPIWPAFALWREQEREAQLRKELAPADLEEARARKTKAEAELAEIALEEKRGALVSLELYREELRRVVGRVRAQLLSVPGRYAPRTAGKATLPESQRAWDAAVLDVLRELREG